MQPTLEQLKAAAYDTLANIEALQVQLKQINTMIAGYKAPEKVEEAIEEKKEEVVE